MLIESLESRRLMTAIQPDPSFGTNGFANIHFPGTVYDIATAITLVDSDGKIIVAGYTSNDGGSADSPNDATQTNAVVARFNPGGTLDATFGTGGEVTLDFGTLDQADSLALQPDGKILVGGLFSGHKDLLPGSSIPLTGYAGVVRLNPNGTVDANFGNGGLALSDQVIGGEAAGGTHHIILQPGGKIVEAGAVAGTGWLDLGLTRFTADGQVDTTFGSGGVSRVDLPGFDVAGDITTDSSGNLIVAGPKNFSAGIVVARLSPDGILDTTFGSGGSVVVPSLAPSGDDGVVAVVVDPSGRIVLGDSAFVPDDGHYEFYLVRLTSAGGLDPSFGSGGTVTTANTEFRRGSLILLDDGKILAAGNWDGRLAVARYNEDGSLDPSFNSTGIYVGNQFADGANDVALQPDGKIVAVCTPFDDTSGTRISDIQVTRLAPLVPTLSLASTAAVYGQTTTLTATLLSDGSPVANALITFSRADNSIIGTAATDASGVATLNNVSIAGLAVGTYPNAFTASFAGDASHAPSAATASLTIIDENIQGLVWVDFNNDGNVDFGEQGIGGVPITLIGSSGNAIATTTTDSNGLYTFNHVPPDVYSISEGATPAGYVEGKDSLGTITDLQGKVISAGAGNASVQDLFSAVPIGADQNAINYNFGEQPAAGSAVSKGQAATMGFWQNKNGQALINKFTSIGAWLADTLPNTFGNLANATSQQVATLYQQKFVLTDKLDAQVMATALNVYATNASLGGSVAASYGFAVSTYGLGDSTWNIASDGAAFNVANNSTLTVLEILQAWDTQANKSSKSIRQMAIDVFGGINAKGGI